MHHPPALGRSARGVRTHLLPALVLGTGIGLALHWSAARAAMRLVGVALVATHLGLAIVGFLGVGLISRAHSGRRPESQGRTIRWAAFYDVLVRVLTFGREQRFREATLDCARVGPGERVLDVGCGTGTLALTAKRRAGPGGLVHGVDAAEAMVARAKHKTMREGLDVTFTVSPAQLLPFPDGAFDVVLCTLVIHHLPNGARRQAIAAMRRVLRPGGRLLVVDFAQERGARAALDPMRLMHGHDDMHVAEEAATLMQEEGFSDIVTGKLHSRVLGYSLGTAGGLPAVLSNAAPRLA